MKTHIITFVLAGISFVACGQKTKTTDIPSVVQNTLTAKYQNPSGLKWEQKGNLYEADFKLSGQEHTVEIDNTGKQLRSKIDLNEKEIPAAILTAIRSTYKNYKIDDVEKMEVTGAVYYQIELDITGESKDIELVFDSNGTLNKQQAYWD
jgi:hypothetical protein